MNRSVQVKVAAVLLVGLMSPIAVTGDPSGGDAPPISLPGGYVIPASTLSPDRRYGVSVFDSRTHEVPPGGIAKNAVVEVRTGRVVGVIDAEPSMTHMNHGAILPARWSPDSSLLLWEVSGKWSPRAIVILKLENGKLGWQRDLLALAQQAILSRTRAAAPEKYAAAKKANADHGAAYPDGFTIDVETLDPIAFPLRVRAVLTSNPKAIEDKPTLESHLEAALDERTNFNVNSFALGAGVSRSF